MENRFISNYKRENKEMENKMQNKTQDSVKTQYLFTSEVVSPGHPDKCADRNTI